MAKSRAITQKDVARRAGVSRSLVSYVINNGPRKVAPETRERVLQAIQELGYRPNKYAQRLKLGSRSAQKSLAILTGGQSYNVLQRPYYNIILAGLFDEAHRLGMEVRLFSFFEALTDPVFLHKNIHRDEISALILLLPKMATAHPGSKDILDTIAGQIDRVVCLEDQIRDWPTVVFDRAQAARQAVDHLIGLGHTRIAFLAIEDERLAGYKGSLLDHGIDFNGDLVFTTDPADVMASAYQASIEMLQLDTRPTAIFTANDEMAISSMAALHDQGISIPGEMAIVSIDNIGISKYVRPSLTTVDVPKRRMASLALQALTLQAQFPDQLPASLVVPTELVIRESCGAQLRD